MNLLILDEPTNHLDISSREALEDALAGYDGTLIAVSHDRYFIDKLATRIITISPDGAVDFRGTYREYEQKKRAAAKERQRCPPPQRRASPRRRTSISKERRMPPRKEKYRKHVEKVRAEIAALEKSLSRSRTSFSAKRHTTICAPPSLEDRRITAEDRLMQLYEEEETFDI